MLSLLALLLPSLAAAAELSPADSAALRALLERSTTSHTSQLATLRCTWKAVIPATICAYAAAEGDDHDSFFWNGNGVARILRRYAEPGYRADGVWVLEVHNLRCEDVCRFD